MKNEYWKTKLTPFDSELFMMVESLTQKPCEPKNGGNHYFFEADYENHKNEPEYISAIWNAIAGRIGEKRLISMEDKPDRHTIFVRVRFNTLDVDLYTLNKDFEPRLESGDVYCRKLDQIRAIQVDRTRAFDLLKFVGNGELEIEKRPGGKATFHFQNAAGSVYAHAPEFSYIVYRGPGRFEIVDKDKFESEYERK